MGLVVLSLVTATTAASETAVGGFDEIPAPGWKTSLRLTSNGDGFLAVWSDGRSDTRTFAARVDGDGNVVDRLGFHVPVGPSSIGWNGEHYVVSGGALATRIGTDGTLVDTVPRRVIPVGMDQLAFATSGGGRSIVVYKAGLEDVFAVVVDGDLAPVGAASRLQPDVAYFQLQVAGAGALPGGRFLVLLSPQWFACPSGCPLFAFEIDPASGAVARRYTIEASPDVHGETIYAFSAGASGFAVATRSYGSGRTVVRGFAPDGTPRETSVLFQSTAERQANRPEIVADAEGYLVSFTTLDGEDASSWSARIDAQGAWIGPLRRLDPDGSPYDQDPVVAWNGTAHLVGLRTRLEAQHDAGNAVGILSAAGEVASLEPLARSLVPGDAVALASGGGMELALWRSGTHSSGESLRVTRFAADGAVLDPEGITVEPWSREREGDVAAAISASPGGFLVAWLDGSELLARRLSLSGTWIDATHRVLATGVCAFGPASLAPSDSGHALVWSSCAGGSAGLLRLGPDAAPLSPPVEIDDPLGSDAIAPSITAGAGSHLIVRGVARDEPCPILCTPPPIALRALAVDASGVPGEARTVIDAPFVGLHPPSIVWTGTTYLAVWGDWEGIHALRLSASGSPLEPVPTLLGSQVARHARPSAAFDGSRVLVVWSDVNDERPDERLSILAIDPARPLRDQQLRVPPGHLAEGLVRRYDRPVVGLVANGPGSFSILYSRVPFEREWSGVSRVFRRTLTSLERTRSVRRR